MSPPCQPGADPPEEDDHPRDERRADVRASLDAASIKRLAEIDDQLAGFADAGIDSGVGNAEFTPELAQRLDTLLLLRLVAADASKPTAPLMIGKFRVIRKIGEGGFAEVYEVIDTRLVRREALKIARPEILLHSGKTNRFLREARLAARVSHPNVVVIHEVGEHEGLPYIAQELCGESLGGWLDRHPGPVAPAIAASSEGSPRRFTLRMPSECSTATSSRAMCCWCRAPMAPFPPMTDPSRALEWRRPWPART
jgi:hypothetical protein